MAVLYPKMPPVVKNKISDSAELPLRGFSANFAPKSSSTGGHDDFIVHAAECDFWPASAASAAGRMQEQRSPPTRANGRNRRADPSLHHRSRREGSERSRHTVQNNRRDQGRYQG